MCFYIFPSIKCKVPPPKEKVGTQNLEHIPTDLTFFFLKKKRKKEVIVQATELGLKSTEKKMSLALMHMAVRWSSSAGILLKQAVSTRCDVINPQDQMRPTHVKRFFSCRINVGTETCGGAAPNWLRILDTPSSAVDRNPGFQSIFSGFPGRQFPCQTSQGGSF